MYRCFQISTMLCSLTTSLWSLLVKSKTGRMDLNLLRTSLCLDMSVARMHLKQSVLIINSVLRYHDEQEHSEITTSPQKAKATLTHWCFFCVFIIKYWCHLMTSLWHCRVLYWKNKKCFVLLSACPFLWYIYKVFSRSTLTLDVTMKVKVKC